MAEVTTAVLQQCFGVSTAKLMASTDVGAAIGILYARANFRDELVAS